MRVLILGMDGYLGWALAQYMTARGHEICGADAFLRRQWVMEMGGHSATPIVDMPDRLIAFREKWGTRPPFETGDLCDWDFVYRLFKRLKPDCIVHFGECPSAPYSMIDVHHAVRVQRNNVVNTMNVLFAMKELAPESHLIKLGTMGEYGTPNVDIPEGFFELEFRGRKDRMPFPRNAGSWYHWSKVHGSNNIMFACRIYGLRATDIMQGVVFGTRIDEMGDDERLLTRLDFDEAFGTAINRYCCQAVIGHPLTPFGKGRQKRGFIPLRDSLQCLTLAAENPPPPGEYRVFNQFEDVHDVSDLASRVVRVARECGIDAEIRNIENPRKESEEHYYNPDRRRLPELGYRPSRDIDDEIKIMLSDLRNYRGRIEEVKDVLMPRIRWSGERRKSDFL